jgi:hypothetical protein
LKTTAEHQSIELETNLATRLDILAVVFVKMATTKKVVRAANFTNEEEHLILDSVEKHKNVIESKKSDSLTWKEKV